MPPENWCQLWSACFSALLQQDNCLLMLTSQLADIPCLHYHKSYKHSVEFSLKCINPSFLFPSTSPTPPLHSWLLIIGALLRYFFHLHWHAVSCSHNILSNFFLTAFNFMLLSLYHSAKSLFFQVSHSLRRFPPDTLAWTALYLEIYHPNTLEKALELDSKG